jgi:hypothetical protein
MENEMKTAKKKPAKKKPAKRVRAHACSFSNVIYRSAPNAWREFDVVLQCKCGKTTVQERCLS